MSHFRTLNRFFHVSVRLGSSLPRPTRRRQLDIVFLYLTAAGRMFQVKHLHPFFDAGDLSYGAVNAFLGPEVSDDPALVRIYRRLQRNAEHVSLAECFRYSASIPHGEALLAVEDTPVVFNNVVQKGVDRGVHAQQRSALRSPFHLTALGGISYPLHVSSLTTCEGALYHSAPVGIMGRLAGPAEDFVRSASVVDKDGVLTFRGHKISPWRRGSRSLPVVTHSPGGASSLGRGAEAISFRSPFEVDAPGGEDVAMIPGSRIKYEGSKLSNLNTSMEEGAVFSDWKTKGEGAFTARSKEAVARGYTPHTRPRTQTYMERQRTEKALGNIPVDTDDSDPDATLWHPHKTVERSLENLIARRDRTRLLNPNAM